MEKVMEKVNVEMHIQEIRKAAKEAGIQKTFGVSKKDLVAQINEVIEKAESLKIVDQTPQENKIEEQDNTPVKPKKWFEEENAYPYQGGEIIQITYNKHKGLIGRLAMVLKPSAKKDATKAQLINPKDGSLQNTQVTLDLSGVALMINNNNELVG